MSNQFDILTGGPERLVYGVDPGISGCVVVMTDTGRLVDHMHMPSVKVGKVRRVDAIELSAFCRQYQAEHCYFEKVHAMPGQGVSSMFSFGHSMGVAEGVVGAMGIPVSHVTPQAWKKTFGLIGSEKDEARILAMELYPECQWFELKGKGQAAADAVLIARHGLI